MTDFDVIRDAIPRDHYGNCQMTAIRPCTCGKEKRDAALAALDALVAERDEARRERDSWRTLAEGWKLTDDVERHRV